MSNKEFANYLLIGFSLALAFVISFVEVYPG